jgi:hypothetical protein
MRGCGLESFEVHARYVNPVRPGSADPMSQVQEMKKGKPLKQLRPGQMQRTKQGRRHTQKKYLHLTNQARRLIRLWQLTTESAN